MKPFKGVMLIDSLAKRYNYTHEQAFNLPLAEAYLFIFKDKTERYLQERMSEIKQQMESK